MAVEFSLDTFEKLANTSLQSPFYKSGSRGRRGLLEYDSLGRERPRRGKWWKNCDGIEASWYEIQEVSRGRRGEAAAPGGTRKHATWGHVEAAHQGQLGKGREADGRGQS